MHSREYPAPEARKGQLITEEVRVTAQLRELKRAHDTIHTAIIDCCMAGGWTPEAMMLHNAAECLLDQSPELTRLVDRDERERGWIFEEQRRLGREQHAKT